MTNGELIYQFVTEAILSGGWMEMDRLYLQNRILSMVGLKEMDSSHGSEKRDVDTMIYELLEIARSQAVITHEEQADELRGQFYDLLTPPPSVLNALFAQQYNDDKEEATQYFHRLSLRNKTIKEESHHRISETNQGALWTSITSGTEEDNIPVNSRRYPACGLCFDNEGYMGDAHYDIRAPYRYIRMNLQGDSFGFRYMPYPLWEEHCLFVAEEHGVQMQSRQTIDQLLQIADVFPHYFVACDIDLLPENDKPQHVVYQGGRPELPVFNRPAKALFKLDSYPNMSVEILDYPLTTCRFRSEKRDDLVQLVTRIIQAWRLYQEDDLMAFSPNGALNHTLNIVARRYNDQQFEVLLLFREMSEGPLLHLAQVLGTEPMNQYKEGVAQILADELVAADPFKGQRVKIDHWMKKINTLGEKE